MKKFPETHETPRKAETDISKYFEYYNDRRRNQGLDQLTPDQVYFWWAAR